MPACLQLSPQKLYDLQLRFQPLTVRWVGPTPLQSLSQFLMSQAMAALAGMGQLILKPLAGLKGVGLGNFQPGLPASLAISASASAKLSASLSARIAGMRLPQPGFPISVIATLSMAASVVASARAELKFDPLVTGDVRGLVRLALHLQKDIGLLQPLLLIDPLPWLQAAAIAEAMKLIRDVLGIDLKQPGASDRLQALLAGLAWKPNLAFRLDAALNARLQLMLECYLPLLWIDEVLKIDFTRPRCSARLNLALSQLAQIQLPNLPLDALYRALALLNAAMVLDAEFKLNCLAPGGIERVESHLSELRLPTPETLLALLAGLVLPPPPLPIPLPDPLSLKKIEKLQLDEIASMQPAVAGLAGHPLLLLMPLVAQLNLAYEAVFKTSLVIPCIGAP